ncbi:dynactin p62 family-domain-containing protein [Obelidium mucronatum]|nr:dynactin p62 family-domain-containing protein [Obelidium mucronatum]
MENPLGGDSTPAPSGGIHYLSCGVCRWDSLEIGLKFDRPTGLAMQMQKTDDERADIQEFSNLKTHFEKKTRTVTAPSNGSMADLFRSSSISLPPSLLANIPALASLSSFSGSKGNLDPDANAVYEAKFTGSEANDTAQLEKMKNLVIEEATTLGQRYQQIEDQPRTHAGVRPQRLLLRTKRTKLCKDCDHVLIKPEQKAQVSKFTIQLPAIDFVPRITIAHPLPTALPLEPGTTYTVHLKVVNPQTNPIDLMFGTVDDTTIDFPASVVTILAPAFKLEALNELEMYDDDKIGHAAPKEAGIVEKKNNWAVFAVEVTVLRIISSTFEVCDGIPIGLIWLTTSSSFQFS